MSAAEFTRRVLRIATLLLVAAVPAAVAGDKPHRAPREARPVPEENRSSFESEHDLAIERARSEIRKNPGQKKFILFRYGLDEKDLR
jgi:hypothetical protein